MIISKEEFVRTLNFIKEQDIKENKFIDALETLSPNSYCDCFLFADYASKLISMLQIMLEDEADDIGYFLYEANWIYQGRDSKFELQFPTDENDKVLYTSPETLYDFLIAEMEKRHEKDN